MVDIVAPVLVQLKNKTADSGRSYKLCLQFLAGKNSSHSQRR